MGCAVTLIHTYASSWWAFYVCCLADTFTVHQFLLDINVLDLSHEVCSEISVNCVLHQVYGTGVGVFKAKLPLVFESPAFCTLVDWLGEQVSSGLMDLAKLLDSVFVVFVVQFFIC